VYVERGPIAQDKLCVEPQVGSVEFAGKNAQ
jgi:hypothetical protein